MLSNFVAIPLTGVLLVPLILSAILLAGSWPALATVLLKTAAWLLDKLIAYLSWLDHYIPAMDVQLTSTGSMLLLLLSTVAVMVLLLPRGLPKFAPALVFLLPLFLPYHSIAGFQLRVEMLDVGQGLAVLVETRKDLLLYDSGPGDGEGRDVVASIVEPAVNASGKTLSTVVISHGDHDHSGGLKSLRSRYPQARYFLNKPLVNFARPCNDSEQIPWLDSVDMSLVVLHPNAHLPYQGNDSSCVLLFRYQGIQMLFTGDISKTVEQRLLRLYPQLQADVMLVPHHGSGSSSAANFVAAVDPGLALISSGFANRFKLPSVAVIERYLEVGSKVMDTARCGAVRLSFTAGKRDPEIRFARQSRAAIWRQHSTGC